MDSAQIMRMLCTAGENRKVMGALQKYDVQNGCCAVVSNVLASVMTSNYLRAERLTWFLNLLLLDPPADGAPPALLLDLCRVEPALLLALSVS